MYLVKPPFFLKPVYGGSVWRVPTEENVLYLTFDDGPIPEVTPWVLALLAEYNAKATFFCVGKNAEAHPALLQQLLDEGHRIGNHSYDHPSGWKTADAAYLANVAHCAEFVGSNLFRPPYGRITRSQINRLKQDYTIVMWDVLAGDYDAKTSPEQCASNVIDHAKPGSIVVFHDSLKAARNLRHALPAALAHFSKAGYRFDVLPDIEC